MVAKTRKAKTPKAKTAKKTKSSKTMENSMTKSSGSHHAYCMHERKKNVLMLNAHKKIITMKNGNKRAQMVGECEHCGKKVYAFVKL